MIQLKKRPLFFFFFAGSIPRDQFKDPVDGQPSKQFGRFERVWAARRVRTTYASFAEASVPCNKLVLHFCFPLCCFVNYSLMSLSPSVSSFLAMKLKVFDTGNCYSTAVWNNNWELTVEIADWVSRYVLVYFYRSDIFWAASLAWGAARIIRLSETGNDVHKTSVVL